MSTVIKQCSSITEKEYLKVELTAEVKHEYVNGYTYAMAGASENHARLSGNIYAELRDKLKNKSCEPFISDMKLKTSTGSFRYPDCMVVCEENNDNPYYKIKAVILVEVLSRSTRKIDEKDKFLEYINIPTLKEYVLIEQDYVDITVYRKSDAWRSTHYFLDEEIYFESIDLTLSVEEVYHRVNNEDMVEFLERKKSNKR